MFTHTIKRQIKQLKLLHFSTTERQNKIFYELNTFVFSSDFLVQRKKKKEKLKRTLVIGSDFRVKNTNSSFDPKTKS